ncbi:MAG: ribosome maturation factor RimM [Ignavibacterium sp.]|uniref:ribosome maturation factor RimM n=1 Tax=Ignavibacterium sp. TaxID=2651167 RepID=UPI004049323C
MDEYFLIAKVVAVSVRDGFLKLKLFTDHPEKLLTTKFIYVDFWGSKKKFFIEEIVKRGENYLFKLKNFSAERELQVFIGREIFLKQSDLLPLPDNSYYIHDLIGCEVFCSEKFLGSVKDVISTPANDVLELITDNNQTRLIPFVLKFFEKINPEEKIIFVKKDFGICDDED